MKIAFIHSSPLYPMGGENIRGHYLLKLLVERGHTIDLISPKSKRTFSEKINYYPVSEVKRFCKSKNLVYLQYFKFGLNALRLLKKLKKRYDLIYCFGISGSLLAYFLSRRNIPLICDFYEADFPELLPTENIFIRLFLKIASFWNRFILYKADERIMLTKIMQTYLFENYGLKSKVAYDAADPELFNKSVKTAHKSFRIIFHGGIEKRDGVLNLLKACKPLTKDYRFGILIIGEGLAKKECEDYVTQEPSLKDKVKFLGWVNYFEIPKYLSTANMACVPCTDLPINKVIPRKIFEYMACGIPIVVSDLKVMREVLDEKGTFFVKPGSVDELTETIKSILEKEEILTRMSKNLIRKTKKLNLKEECEKIIRMIKKIK